MGDAFLQTIDQLRLMVGENKAKNWGNQYLWDVRFPDAPDPFKDWFPAIDIDVGHTTLNAHNIRFFLLDYSFPKESAETTIDMTFYDTEDLVLEHWLASWILDDIFPNMEGVLPLGDPKCTRQIQIKALNSKKEQVGDMMDYLVFPEGGVNFKGSSSNGPLEHSIKFFVVG